MPDEFTLSSPAFRHNGVIPEKYTVDGDNINPPLQILGVPEAAVSLALIMEDPDAATDPDGAGRTFVHWVLFNIPSRVREIAENSTPERAVNGINSAGKSGYIGPAPPNGEHRYFFKLFALSDVLDVGEVAEVDELISHIKPILLAQTELVGRYARLLRVG